jgi:hypothetical protein
MHFHHNASSSMHSQCILINALSFIFLHTLSHSSSCPRLINVFAGDVFTTPMEALKFYKPLFSDITDLITQAPDIGRALTQSSFDGTFFAPINARMLTSAGGAQPAAPVLPYHVAQGFKPFPFGFKLGKSFATLLKGHGLKVEITK